jgi:SAM-dependent methyltransferase
MTSSDPYPFKSVEHLFCGKRVLEIGPGQGRQYRYLRHLASAYDVCDISSSVMREPSLRGIPRWVIHDYDDQSCIDYDVVHFWYVLHHVPIEELRDFFSFVRNRLQPDGIVLFNTPREGNPPEWYRDDGIGTTSISLRNVEEALGDGLQIFLKERVDDRSTGWLIGLERPI